MKKILSLVLAALLLLPSFTAFANVVGSYGGSPVIEGNKINVGVNGTIINFDVDPVLQDGRVLVPARVLLNALGVSDEEIRYQDGNISIWHNDVTVNLVVGSDTASVNGRTVSLDVPVFLTEGKAMLPVRFVAETLGWDVQWMPFYTNKESTVMGGIVDLASKRPISPVTIMAPSEGNAVDIGLLEKASGITGVKVQIMTVPTENYRQKAAVMIAAGEPAVIMEGGLMDPSVVDQWIGMDVFFPQNKYIEKFAPNIKMWLDRNPDVQKALTKEAGNIYALPVMKPNGTEYYQFFITKTMKNPEAAVTVLSCYASLLSKEGNYQENEKNPIPVVVPMDQNTEAISKLNEASTATGVSANFAAIDVKSSRERVNLRIAAGEPSVFFNVSMEKKWMDNLAEQGALLPLEELVEKYAPNIQKFLKENPGYKDSITDKAGHFYALPVLPSLDTKAEGAPEFFITTTVKNPQMAIQWFDYFYTEAGRKLLTNITEASRP